MLSNLARCTSCYYLELLRYGGFTRISEYRQLLKNEEENDEKPPMVAFILNKIMSTVVYVVIRTLTGQDLQNMCSGTLKPVEWGSAEESMLNEKGKHLLSKQAFIEFNEYLVEKDFFVPRKSGILSCCIS